MRNMNVFDVKTLRPRAARTRKPATTSGDYFGLPWPCYGTPELKHPGSPNLYDTSKHVMDGGGNFRANFGVERDGVSAAGRRRLALAGRRHHHRLPRVRPRAAQEAGLVGRADRCREKAAEGKNWKTDLSGGIHRVVMKVPRLPSVRQRQGARRGLELPRPDSPAPRAALRHRPDLVAKYPTHDDKKAFWRLPTLYKSAAGQEQATSCTKIPAHHDLRRLVEYEGGGEETRSNPWLAELQQEMFVEINPKAPDRGIRNGEPGVGEDPDRRPLKVQALVTERVGPDTVFLPFHFSGRWQGARHAGLLPGRRAPHRARRGGQHRHHLRLRRVTMMQETKTTICKIEKA
jgi:formate dehydrogenase major subunit